MGQAGLRIVCLVLSPISSPIKSQYVGMPLSEQIQVSRTLHRLLELKQN